MSASRKPGKLFGVGVGPGDPNLLTLRAVQVLQAVDVIFHVSGPRSRESISKNIVETIDGCAAKSEELLFSMSTDSGIRNAAVTAAAERVAAVLREGKDCAFATIGDPLIYSTFSYLLREVRDLVADVPVEVVPGITAFQAAAAAWKNPLAEDEEVLTVVPRWSTDRTHLQAVDAADTVVCLKTYRERNVVLQALRETMCPDELLYAARIGHTGEVLETDPDAVHELPIDYISLLVARRRKSHG